MSKIIRLILLMTVLHVVGAIYASANRSYVHIYPGKLNEVEISTNATNQIKCAEAIKKISFDKDNKENIDFSYKDNVATIQHKGRQNILMLLETTQKSYTVLLRPTVGIGPQLLIAESLADAEDKNGSEYLTPEGVNRVFISNKEVNRVTCDDKSAVIEEIKLPEDSGILTEIDGSDAFLQYWGGDEVPIDIRTTDKVYQVVLKPANIGAKTLILKDSKKLSVMEIYGNTREEIVVKLVKAAMTQGPELKQAVIKRNDQVVRTVNQIEFVEHIQYNFNSEGIFLVEYWLRSKEKTQSVDEEYILQLGIFNGNTMGLSLEDDYLYPDKITRLFIVGSQ